MPAAAVKHEATKPAKTEHPAAVQKDEGKARPTASVKREDVRPGSAVHANDEPVPATGPSVDVLRRELLESKRSWRLVWMLCCFTAAYAFIVWASLTSPVMLLVAVVLLPFLPFRWWEVIFLLISVILIFSVCRWDDVHTGMRLYRDAREGHWL